MNKIPDGRKRLITKEEAQSVLDPHLPILRDCIVEAWKAWERLGELPELRLPLSAFCRARFIYDHIAYAARARFDNRRREGIRLSETRGFLLIDFHGKVLIRFKKLGKDARSRNLPTRQQLLFTLQLELPGLPPAATRLIAGYQLDPLEMGIDDLLVTCPVGNKVEWVFSIQDQEPPNMVPFPGAAPSGPAKPIVLPKSSPKKMENDDPTD